MVELAHTFAETPGLRSLVVAVGAGWRLVALCVLASVSLAVAGLRFAPAEHTAVMVVGPTARTGAAAMGARVPLLGSDGTFGMAEPGPGEETLSDFARFLELLGSVPVAERLMADPALAQQLFPGRWEAAEGRWMPAAGVLPGLKRLLLALVGREDWVEPDAVILAKRIRERLVVTQVGTSPMRRLAFRHADRAFALDLLGRLAAAADGQLRAEAVRRSAAQIAYIRAKLATVTVAEHRRALIELLAEQERVSMLIEVDLPFAADPIEPPSAARLPDWPDPLLVLLAALAGGVMTGVTLASVRARRP